MPTTVTLPLFRWGCPPPALNELIYSILIVAGVSGQLGTSNELAISVRKVVDPWRVDPRNKFYQAAECAIRDVWKQARRASAEREL